MNLTIARIGKNDTIKFASSELMRLFKAMDPSIHIDGRVYEVQNGLAVLMNKNRSFKSSYIMILANNRTV